jgi:hypothetical protein
MAERKLFDHLKQITGVQDPNYWEDLTDAEKKSFSNFMVHRFLSMNPDWLDLLFEIQPYTEILDGKSLYLAYIGLLPKGKTFLRYIKGKKDKDNHPDWLMDLMVKEFECSKRDINEYLEIMYKTKEGRTEIKEICEKYGTDPKMITKLKLKV